MSQEILSRIITHPKRIAIEPQNQGVAIPVLNLKDQFLLVQQSYQDLQFGREAEKWNIITGTRENDERVKGTVIRELAEETNQEWANFVVINRTYRETNGIYIAEMGYHFKFRCCMARYLGNPDIDPNLVFKSSDGEINAYMWGDWSELKKYDLEEGARLVLAYYGREFGFIT